MAIYTPGSGKTILGLEVVRRLNRPTLILAPTITIRNQWVERFQELFLTDSKLPEWVTTNIKEPKFLTVATYQALHCAYSGKEEGEDEENVEEQNSEEQENETCKVGQFDLIGSLKKAGIMVILVDEAHHLRNEWWKTLFSIYEKLENPTTVALTATPPYDVSQMEWERYQGFCGPVDAEISVPELVMEGNLCPHQDYVYFSLPSPSEEGMINEFRAGVDLFYKDICSDSEFIAALQQHLWAKDPETHVEEILDNPEYFSSIGIFLYHTLGILPNKFKEILGVGGKGLPPLNLQWIEILLTGCIFADKNSFGEYKTGLEEIKRRLIKLGAIEKKKVILNNSTAISKALARSITKLDSVVEIAKLETSCLEDALRMVILTDYIRKSDFPEVDRESEALNHIGIVPIFEILRKNKVSHGKIGILSGSLVVLPNSSVQMLKDICSDNDIDHRELEIVPLKHDLSFSSITLRGKENQKSVKVITEVFNKGGVNILVGTKSLLGEGWDAPSINSLILASFVGSFMLSNQMRGRAIRVQAGNPQKTANIWHLVCMETGSNPGADLETLIRRFKAFVGLSNNEVLIQNGIKRLDIGLPPYTDSSVATINENMKQKSMDRPGLIKRWEEALKRGKDGVDLIEEIHTRAARLPRGFVFYNTITALFYQGLFTGLYIISNFMRDVRFNNAEQYIIMLKFAAGAGMIVALPMLFKALWLLLLHGRIETSMKQISEALLKTLVKTGAIKTNIDKLEIQAEEGKYVKGSVICSLKGGTSYEKSLFLDSLHQILNIVDNPRYILIRNTPLFKLIRKDYHPVPEIIGTKKEYAEFFAKMWTKYVGSMKLVYTRSVEGRRILLKARMGAVSAAFVDETERVICWK